MRSEKKKFHSREEGIAIITTITAWTVVLGATVLASLVMWAAGWLDTWREVALLERQVICPREGKAVEVHFLVRKGQLGSPLDVFACSLFTAGEQINCGKACLPLAQV